MSARIKKERGITLIALVVTIIILLILAGVSIQMLLGDQGLIKKAVEAVERTEIADYEEQLDLLGVELAMDEAADGKPGSFAEKFEEKLKGDKNFDGSHVTPKDDDSLIVETEEGHVFEVTDEGTDYLGEKGDEGLEALPEGIEKTDLEINIEPTDETWAKSVEVTINIADAKEELQKFEIEYSEDGEIWKEYNKSFTVKKTETIYAKIVSALGEEAKVTTEKEITNIDTVPPEEIELQIAPTEANTVVTAKVKDGTKTEVSGQSGIKTISFRKQGDDAWIDEPMENDDPSVQVTQTHTFEGLTQEDDYTIEVKATDEAGNEKEGSITNKAIPDLSQASEEEIKIECNPAPPEWSNTSVHVTLSGTYTSDGNYTLQYTKNYSEGTTQEGDWTDYKDGFDVTDNGKIGIRLKSGEQHGGVKEHEIKNIDKDAPTLTIAEQREVTTSTIKVDATASDNASGIEDTEIKYYILEGDKDLETAQSSKETEKGSGTTCTFTKLKQGTLYTILVEATDKVGNTKGEVVKETTKTIPTANTETSGNIIITYSPEEWTRSNVNVTLAKGEEVSEEFSLQYVKDDVGRARISEEIEWQNYDESPIQVEKNETIIYVRLWNGTEGGELATGTVGNIDRVAPDKVTLEQGTVAETAIEVTAKATDATDVAKESGSGTSGIAKFVFSYKEKDGEGDFTTPDDGIITKEVTTETATQEQTETYKYTSLKPETEYTLKVDVSDQAGNKTANKTLDITTGSSETAVPDPEPNGEPCVGDYADIDNDGDPDGIIYADVAVNQSGQWADDLNATFTITKKEKLKTYYVESKSYIGSFGDRRILATRDGEGIDRFYVMDLNDIGSSWCRWWDSTSIYDASTETTFGSGKTNTINMLKKYSNTSSDVLWGLPDVKSRCSETGHKGKTWFVPSKEEWAAFGYNLEITESNYNLHGLKRYYWSSSLYDPSHPWYAVMYTAAMTEMNGLTNTNYVRLSVTF